MEDMLGRMRWAIDTLGVVEKAEEVDPTTGYRLLLTLYLATHTTDDFETKYVDEEERATWLHNMSYQILLSDFISNLVETGIMNPEAKLLALDAVTSLPNSPSNSELLIKLLESIGSTQPVWNYDLIARISPQKMEEIRADLAQTPPTDLPMWKLSLVAKSGSDRDLHTLESFRDRAKIAAVSGRFTQRVKDDVLSELDLLIELQYARSDPHKLLLWMLDAEFGTAQKRSEWAFARAAQAISDTDPFWIDFWEKADQRISETAERSYQKALNEGYTPDQSRLWIATDSTYLRELVLLADQHSVPVPRSLRERAIKIP